VAMMGRAYVFVAIRGEKRQNKVRDTFYCGQPGRPSLVRLQKYPLLPWTQPKRSFHPRPAQATDRRPTADWPTRLGLRAVGQLPLLGGPSPGLLMLLLLLIC
jgi:hypothetical protein